MLLGVGMGAGRREQSPDHIKVLKGTDQPCRMKHNDKKQAANEIEAPPFLSEDARKYFDHIGEELTAIKLNSRTYSYRYAAMATEQQARLMFAIRL